MKLQMPGFSDKISTSSLALFGPGLDDAILHEKISIMINDFQEVIDKHKLSDEILVIAKRLE